MTEKKSFANNEIVVITVIAIITGVLLLSFNRPIETAFAAAENNNEPPLPVLLVHGLGEDASVWNKWVDLLKKDGIRVNVMTFQKSDDKCGAAIAHATELGERIQAIKKETGYDRINIVGHSKGGIDARVYLGNTTNKDVANLIMLGTPNAGTPLSQKTNVCAPAVWDTIPGANATKAKMNPNTKYYTIGGDWQHNLGGNPLIPGPDDGQVPLASAEPGGNFTTLGTTPHQHMELMGQDEYNLAKDVILGKK
jgi:uncharacterized alpha/beta hydrolase family protein